MAGAKVWSSMQLSKTDPVFVSRAAPRQGQSHLLASRLDQHRASTAHCAAGRLGASVHQKIKLGPCHKHACLQFTASTAKSGSLQRLFMRAEYLLLCSSLGASGMQDASELWNHDAIQTAELFQELRLGKTNCLADNRQATWLYIHGHHFAQ